MESRKENKNKSDSENDEISGEKSDLTGDYGNVAVLLLLYLMQGIPLGITAAIPLLLQNRGVTYKEQAAFSFAFYPFTVKILWAPIVDSLYVKSWGRRKSWIVPSQLLIGAFMLLLSQYVDEWLGDEKSKNPQVLILAIMFFILFFLTATQDIAVDGWAIGMLKRRNVGYAATCNMVGQVVGYTISYSILLVFESKDFCNHFLFKEPRDEGLISFATFIRFCGISFIVVTVLIAILKHENMDLQEELEDHPDYGVKKAYPVLWKIIKLKPVIKLAILIISVKICVAACDGIAELKLIEYKVPKDKVALVSMGKTLARILAPIFVRKWTTGKFPMNVFKNGFPFRMLMIVVLSSFVYYTPSMVENGISSKYLLNLFILLCLYEIPFVILTVAEMSFYAKITDPLLGGTYMTLMTTITNLGQVWMKTIFLWLMDVLTWKSCNFSIENNATNFDHNSIDLLESENLDFVSLSRSCYEISPQNQCTKVGGKCETIVDGFFIEVAAGVIFAVFWFYFGGKLIRKLQNLPIKSWHVLSNQTENLEKVSLSC